MTRYYDGFDSPGNCWHIKHKVAMNCTKENPFESAKKWVDENKQDGEEYVILKCFLYDPIPK